MINLILCGGSGTRLWPISRENLPKQFLKMFDDKSLFQLTIQRNQKYCDKTLIVTNAEQFFISQDQSEEIQLNKNLTFIVESIGRNTAAAIAFGAFACDKDEILFVTPSDHLIKNNSNYKKMIEEGKKAAENGYLVTFGIEPTQPHTGYGYIEAKKNNNSIMDVKLFHEKPNLQTATKYLENNSKSNNENSTIFLWNSGMFMFKANSFLEELKIHAPEVYDKAFIAYKNSKKDSFIKLHTQDMLDIPNISVDYAVMEKSNKIKVIKSDIEWNDVGSFDSLDTIFEKDENNNTKHDKLVALNSKNNFVFGKYKTIALNNVNDLIIIETPTALLVSKKGESQKIKDIVQILKQKNPQLVKYGRTVYTPWGRYTNLDKSNKFKLKTIVVEPGKRLSLQKHFHRSEHWIVVRGTALVQRGDEKFLLRPNESTYIKIGELHRLENVGKIPLELVEVQVGEYLEEDDIVRIDDDFGRNI